MVIEEGSGGAFLEAREAATRLLIFAGIIRTPRVTHRRSDFLGQFIVVVGDRSHLWRLTAPQQHHRSRGSPLIC